MIESLDERFAFMEDGIKGVRTFDKVGTVRRVTGLIIESEGPEVSIGQVCSIVSDRHSEKIEAQVVGFRENSVLLMALDSVHLIHPGCKVSSQRNNNFVPCGPSLLGRIIDECGMFLTCENLIDISVSSVKSFRQLIKELGESDASFNYRRCWHGWPKTRKQACW